MRTSRAAAWRSRRNSTRAGARCSPMASSSSTPTVRGTRIRRCQSSPWSASVRSRTCSRPTWSICTSRAMSASATWCSPAPSGTSNGGSGTNIPSTSRITTPAPGTHPRPATAAPRKALPASTTPIMAAVPSRAVTRRRSSTHYNVNPERWSNELRLSSKAGERLHWLVGAYWQVTNDHNINEHVLTCRGCSTRAPRSKTISITTGSPSRRCPPVSGTPTPKPVTTSRPANSPTSIST